MTYLTDVGELNLHETSQIQQQHYSYTNNRIYILMYKRVFVSFPKNLNKKEVEKQVSSCPVNDIFNRCWKIVEPT